jgi:predicted O-linked N-acetylglucosamine transferase (SPINDLY family)
MLTAQQLNSRLNEAIAHHRAGRLDRAEAIYRQLAPAAPRLALLFQLWAELAEQQGRYEDAIRYYTQAQRNDPNAFPLVVRLAQALMAVGRHAEAERLFRRFLEKNPQQAEAWNALGFVLKVLNRIPEALACHQKAVTINPKLVEGWTHFGLTFGIIGETAKALKMYERALSLDPHFPPALYGRAETLQKAYRFDEALAEYDRYIKLVPTNLEARSYRLFALQNSPTITREQLFAEHQAYGALTGRGAATLPGYDLDPNRRLRVAILSPDLRTHSCAYFLEPLLKHLDREQFEIHLYHDHFSEDATSARLKTYAAKWRNFIGQSHPVVEATIRGDKPDILIDLSGHIGVSIRLPIIAKRLAPVQITYLGYPDTTGVPAVDYRFTDPMADPVGEADAFATEKLVRFSDVAWAYQPPANAPEVPPLPCLTSGRISFGCFNSPTKFNDSLLKTWARLLQAVPDSRLVLKGRDFEAPSVREYMLAWFERCGISSSRLELLARTAGTAEHLALYSKVDIALDTFPYNGTTTTCEALWMGRPVVTIRGGRHAARVGSSLLTTIGRPEWVAADTESYIATAVALAAESRARGTGWQLREALAGSALLDHEEQSKKFAAALRQCWAARTGVGQSFPGHCVPVG